MNFHIHRVNLDASATGFPSPETPCHINIINLPETAATLELLFRFIYPLELPDLDEEKFEALYMLAEAAEKYRVYTAIALCKTILKSVSHSSPVWSGLMNTGNTRTLIPPSYSVMLPGMGIRTSRMRRRRS